ncbi:hypothetical protein GPECTOR_51g729 [Gonium pectorale]|uniref:Hedgehog protein Hint domain-containing protein n=1 Tax=Gonium pectorale TaxID=33097 RepID=A0A150G7J7_GONPE|nr:hypothetical protein GPECTOR_51g729 [Gonium pectorale]|eukprot:KXZ45743.1 hypothetical protein GPECTOR_51g729 [Gonium pectorale]
MAPRPLLVHARVVTVIEAMLKEQSMKRMYRFMTIGLFVVVLVLIGTLSGITFAIVTTYSNSTFQFMQTKDGKAAVMGGAALDLSDTVVRATNAGNGTRRSLHELTGGSARLRRRLSEADNTTRWVYISTLSYATISLGCSLLDQHIYEFPVTSPESDVFVDGSSVNLIKVLDQTGCKSDFNNVSALIEKPPILHPSEIMEIRGRRRLLQKSMKGLVLPSLMAKDVEEEEEKPCFPSSATVEVLGRGTVRMSELQYGDLVRSRDRSTGAVVHRPVFLFGHREAAGARPYVHITAAGRTLAASAGHFVPVCVARCSTRELREGAAVMENRRAGAVYVGDIVVAAAPLPHLAEVAHVEVFVSRGAYNPYIRGADLFVDGLLASPHSDWLLDPVAPGWMVPLLPAIYEALLAPVYGLYCAVGPATAEWLAHGLRLAELGREQHTFFVGYWAALALVAAPMALGSAAVVVAGRAAMRRAFWAL